MSSVAGLSRSMRLGTDNDYVWPRDCAGSSGEVRYLLTRNVSEKAPTRGVPSGGRGPVGHPGRYEADRQHPLKSAVTGSGSNNAARDSACMGTRPTLSACLLAGMLAVGCNDPGAGEDAGWLDYFEPVDTLQVADSVLVRLLLARDSAQDGLWRVPGLGSQAWLHSPADGMRAAEALMGFPPDIGQVPYWPSWVSFLGARAAGTVFGAADLVYVVRAYGTDGSWGDSIFTAPPSWRQARRPERG